MAAMRITTASTAANNDCSFDCRSPRETARGIESSASIPNANTGNIGSKFPPENRGAEFSLCVKCPLEEGYEVHEDPVEELGSVRVNLNHPDDLVSPVVAPYSQLTSLLKSAFHIA